MHCGIFFFKFTNSPQNSGHMYKKNFLNTTIKLGSVVKRKSKP